jgi:hypothetical protein
MADSLLHRLWKRIEREYERRIRRASEVVEYQLADHPLSESHTDKPEEAEEEVEIVNLPKGTPIQRNSSKQDIAE